MTPLVSVVVPTYEGARFLEQTLDSVLAQTLADFEVVVADDASSDDSVAIARDVARRDPRVRIVPTSGNVGAVANWNRAVAQARGEFIKVMGQDDLLRPTCLERQVEVLRNEPATGWVVAGRDIVDDRGRTVMRGRRPLGGTAGVVTAEQALALLVRSGTNVVGEPVTVLLRRSLVEQVGPFRDDLPYVVDVDYWCRALAVAPVHVLPDTLSSFRVSAQSWSAALASRQSDQMCALFTNLQRGRPDVITTSALKQGCVRARAIARARRLVYVALSARAKAETARSRGDLGSGAAVDEGRGERVEHPAARRVDHVESAPVEKYAYYFAASRPEFVTRLLERKHGSLLELATRGTSTRTVLEVGPGEGFFARACRAAGLDYLAIESSPTGVAVLREQGFSVTEATLPPFPEGPEPVDLLYASHLVEHLPGPDAVLSFLQEAGQLLAPGGRLVLVYPDARWMRMDFWESDYTHQWPSTPRRVAQVAQDAGLVVEQSYDCCLDQHGGPARALRAASRLYPQRLLSAVDRPRADFWFRGKLLFVPDSLTIFTRRD